MKKLILFILAFPLICLAQTQKKLTVREQINTIEQLQKNLSVEIDQINCGQYVTNFLSKSKLRDNANRFAIGGDLDFSYLSNWTAIAPIGQYDVLNLFPCFVPGAMPNTGTFFVAYNTSTVLDTSKCGCEMTPMLKKSAGEFTYTSPNYSPDDVLNYLSEHPTTYSSSFPADISRADATTAIANFKIKYSNDDNPPVAYNYSACTYFSKKEIDEIRIQVDPSVPGFRIIGIRYLMGYDHTMNDNKIRIILVGVDQTGKSYITKKNGTPAKMMEKAWPPDNCTH